MRHRKIIPIEDAIALIRDGDTVASAGYGGHGTPEALLAALQERFLATAAPANLTLIWAGGQGDARGQGLDRLGEPGLLRRAIGGHYGLMPRIERLALDNAIAAYNLPEGVITHLYRDIAAGKPGTLSKVGIGTFVDPRQDGGKVNAAATEDIVTLLTLAGEETLFFKVLRIDVALIRATTADPDGNLTMERESLNLETLALAQAARNSGGVVLAQVERVAQAGSLDARAVRVPGILVDAVVIAAPERHMQSYGTLHNPAMSGELRAVLEQMPPLAFDERKVLARRAALQLLPNSVINLGLGLPDAVGLVAGEERVHDLITLTADPGVIGGVPLGGADFGAAVNFSAVVDHAAQFDFIDGGGLDMACLGFAECDQEGNVNASRFANRLSGCGGFIDISQNSKQVVFMGTFTSGGLKVAIAEGALRIEQEGRHRKFVNHVEQVTFNGARAAARDQDVLYVTERCVFRRASDGLELIEIAPGIDLERDILALLPFVPAMPAPPRLMDPALFRPEPMGLRERMLDIHIEDRLSYDAESNTVYMNYAGMRVRSKADIDRIIAAVDGLLGPLNKRVYSIVNYDRFEADQDVMDAYLDAVRYVENRYYLQVSRYTNSGFMRLKLGSELGRRRVSSHVWETRAEATRRLREAE